MRRAGAAPTSRRTAGRGSLADDVDEVAGIIEGALTGNDCSGSIRRELRRFRFHRLLALSQMDLDRALAFSRYAERALRRASTLRAELEATLDAPFDWTGARRRARRVRRRRQSAWRSPARCGRCAGACSCIRWLRDLTGRATLAEVVQAMSTLAERALRAAHRGARARAGRRPRRADRRGNRDAAAARRHRAWASSAAASSTCRPTSISSSPIPEEGETDGARPHLQPRVLRPARPAADRRALARRRRRLRLPRRHAAAPLRRERTADRLVRRARAIPGDAGARVGALRVAQGAAADRRAARRADARWSRRSSTANTSTTTRTRGLRDIHRQIREQEKRKDYAHDIKLGAGGIREIEFVVQALQIVRGGREPALRLAARCPRSTRSRRAQRDRAARGRACCATATSSCATLEHRLQYRDDRQTQIAARRRSPSGLARARRWDSARRARSTRACASIAGTSRDSSTRVFDAPGDDAPQADGERSIRARCGTSRRPRRKRSARSRDAGFDDAGGARADASRRCAKAAAICNCRRCRASASTSWCRGCSPSPRRTAAPAHAPTPSSSGCWTCSRRSAAAARISRC